MGANDVLGSKDGLSDGTDEGSQLGCIDVDGCVDILGMSLGDVDGSSEGKDEGIIVILGKREGVEDGIIVILGIKEGVEEGYSVGGGRSQYAGLTDVRSGEQHPHDIKESLRSNISVAWVRRTQLDL